MKTNPREIRGKISDHRRISAEHYVLKIQAPEIARTARPGQFVMLRLGDAFDPLLRRPFSFFRIRPPKKKSGGGFAGGGFEICYRVAGRGTARLTRLRKGERVDVLGPLGRGFWREEGRERLILVGGGIGIAPLVSWAEELAGARGERKAGRGELRPEVLIGGRTAERLPGARELKNMGLAPRIATEDGSAGLAGTATDLLDRELMSQGQEGTAIYACGPEAMLAKVAQIAEQFDIPCQVLLESRMACGVGACLGCAVKIRAEEGGEEESPTGSEGGPCEAGAAAESPFGEEAAVRISRPAPFRYGRVCKEGPVFRAREILWE